MSEVIWVMDLWLLDEGDIYGDGGERNSRSEEGRSSQKEVDGNPWCEEKVADMCVCIYIYIN